MNQDFMTEFAASANPSAHAFFVRIGGLAKRFWYVPVLVAYAAMVGYTASCHEPWTDEAQAWLIARDTGIDAEFFQAIRYEGHPALWYLLVKAAIFLGLPYESFNFFSGAIATLGIGFLLAKSPFPKWLAVLLPFTYYLAYQYAVIARSYVLLPLLLFAAAASMPGKWEKPIRWILLLLLMANLSSHSFFIASGIVFIHILELFFRWSSMDARMRKRNIAAISLFIIGALSVVVMQWPAKDCAAALGINGAIHFSQLWKCALTAVDSAFFGFPMATVVLLLLSCYWFWLTGLLPLFLASCLPVFGIFLLLRIAYHHHGIIFLAWLFVFWCSVDAFREIRLRGALDLRLRRTWYAMLFLTAALIVRQGIWTFQAIDLDRSAPYCGAKRLANEIKSRNLTKYRLAMQGWWTVALQPYFPKNIFVNYPNPRGSSYIDWHATSCPLTTGSSMQESLSEPFDILIWAEDVTKKLPTIWTDPRLASQLPPNWRYAGFFSGRVIFKNKFEEPTGLALFASRRVADELDMPTVEYDSSIPESERSFLLPDEYAVYSALFHLNFGKLLRILEPDSATSQFQYAIDAALSIDGPTYHPCLLARLQHIAASAHCCTALTLASSDPKQAMEHLQEAVSLVPQNIDQRIDNAVDSAQQGRLQKTADELRQALLEKRGAILDTLSEEIEAKREQDP